MSSPGRHMMTILTRERTDANTMLGGRAFGMATPSDSTALTGVIWRQVRDSQKWLKGTGLQHSDVLERLDNSWTESLAGWIRNPGHWSKVLAFVKKCRSMCHQVRKPRSEQLQIIASHLQHVKLILVYLHDGQYRSVTTSFTKQYKKLHSSSDTYEKGLTSSCAQRPPSHG